VLDADIRGFFDNIDHEWLLTHFRHLAERFAHFTLMCQGLVAIGDKGSGKRSAIGMAGF
jgi:hypothetical protein